MCQKGLTIAVFAASLLVLLWHAGRPGIATGYVDPVAKIHAQAEAMYAAGTFEIAEHGDWMTPRFAGRYALWKPPVLNWLSAIAVKAIGRNALALRLPSIVAGAVGVALVCWWLLSVGASTGAALTGAILLLSSHLFFTLSRIAMMDVLLTFEIVLAMYVLSRDPRLESGRSVWMFGGALGAAVMTKALAGLLPLIILCVLFVISRERPSAMRMLQVVAIGAAIALPWHLYQLVVHHRWFIDEYILTETLTYGMKSPPQETQESQLGFYVKRLLLLDPILLGAAALALIRVRSKLLLVWAVVIFAAALTFQYRNDAYLTPLYPALAILVAMAIPRRRSIAFGGVALLLLIGKAVASTQAWGIPFEPENVNPSLAALNEYAAMKRGNDLAVVDTDDEFYSACIGLPHIRYVWIDPNPPRRFPLDFQYLGILISAAEYARMAELQPEFERRLRAEGLNTSDPIPTSILAKTPEELGELIRTHPQVDFFLPGNWTHIDQGVHVRTTVPINGTGDRVFLLAREKIQRP
jgi:4-amino-4-deoxy-L-arabinose transferase-like glycosyltransferase